jgi:phosphoglycerate dehydrogenase-like enzyme
MPKKPFYVALALCKPIAERILNAEDYEILCSFANVNPREELPEEMTLEFMASVMQNADACITCWGTPNFTEGLIGGAKKLRLVAHAAGTVKFLLPPFFWEKGIRVTNNAAIITEDVAQTILAYILCTTKGLWWFAENTRAGNWGEGVTGVFKERRLEGMRVGIVGASYLGRETVKYLKPFGCEISLYDPYVSPIDAAAMGVGRFKAIDDLVKDSDIIVLCTPAIESCRHLLNKDNIPLMKDDAILINAARGMCVDEDALVKELETGRIYACLDVTEPEPPAADHPFRKLKNVILTPHIAGGHTENGRFMMGRNTVNEVYNYLHKGLLKYEVRKEMLDLMA